MLYIIRCIFEHSLHSFLLTSVLLINRGICICILMSRYFDIFWHMCGYCIHTTQYNESIQNIHFVTLSTYIQTRKCSFPLQHIFKQMQVAYEFRIISCVFWAFWVTISNKCLFTEWSRKNFKKKSCIGPTETRTRIAGFRVQSANHYTIGPYILNLYVV